MSSVFSNFRILLLLSLVLTTSVGSARAGGNEDRATIDRGRELFQKEWVFDSQAIPEREPEENNFTFERRLMEMQGDGLGPMHNAVSCEKCHASGGGAGVDRNVTLITLDPRTLQSVTKNGKRAAIRRQLLELYPGLLSPLGFLSMETVVHEKSTRASYAAIRNRIGEYIPGDNHDSWLDASKRTVDVVAETPVLAGRVGPLDFYLSQRNSPPLYGLGLIDTIDTSRLRSIARSQARRTGGKVTGRMGAGKFGWRGQTATLSEFVRGACANELGLQVHGNPQPADAADASYASLGMDLDEHDVGELIAFVRTLPAPIQETKLGDERIVVREGKQLFNRIGCNVCHVERIGSAHGIYSDLLLHDMGDLLQAPSPASVGKDFIRMPRKPNGFFPPETPPLGSHALRLQSSSGRGGYFGGFGSIGPPLPYPMPRPEEPKFPPGELPDGLKDVGEPVHVTWDALQREWKTPPLWGVADSAPYLHDGRAATLDAAIRWHDGEASESAAGYRGLRSEDRKKLIAFLASLRAPVKEIRQEVDLRIEPEYVMAAPDDDAKTLQEMAEELSVFDPER